MPSTADSPTFLNPQTLARLQGLRLRAQHIVEGYVAGLHRSPYHGFSIEFAEHREYAPGDDLRYVDWKVYGRSDKIHLKQYEDETNLLAYLVVDTSESMTYRGPDAPWSKLEYAHSPASLKMSRTFCGTLASASVAPGLDASSFEVESV